MMDDTNQQTDQQGYGQNEDPTRAQGQQPREQQANAQPLGGNDSNSGSGTTLTSGSSTGDADMATGQAAYGNSGQGDLMQDDEEAGLANDVASTQNASQGSSGFIGSGGSDDDVGLSSSMSQQNGSSSQDFASQGQGALDSETLAGDPSRDDDDGTDDIEIERGQSRDQDSGDSIR